MIATFFLTKSAFSNELVYKELDIVQYPITDDIFQNLKLAIDWANQNDEEIIYFITGNNIETKFNFNLLENTINDLVEQGVFSMYVNVQTEYTVKFTPCLNLIFGITEVRSFILTKPLFSHITSFMAVKETIKGITWTNFLQSILPNNFLFTGAESPILHLENKIFAISPFRNIRNYIEEYFESIKIQDYKNYHITLIDDCSVDNSLSLIPDNSFITKIRNTERKYALKNTIDALMSNTSIKDEDIVCIIDGDDKLSHKYVFNILNAVYQDPNLLFTYGAMNYIGNNTKIGAKYSEYEYYNLRKSNWKISHLRTFRYKLFKKLIEVDPELNCLRNASGHILRMPSDMALLFPLMEIAGYNQTRYLDTPLYKYRVHEFNDHFVNTIEQYEGDIEVRNKTPFKPLF
ncbi:MULTISPECIES: glycosyltransferase family A protein [Sphingobacterium]|uniref:glycosyltransferase family A protein n=1 Tax=Sphingobacterium TaxID=28453 RepID=UPI00257EE8D8|nr:MULTISPECIES: glycosyltransferase family A protein [Sphingobacterium]